MSDPAEPRSPWNRIQKGDLVEWNEYIPGKKNTVYGPSGVIRMFGLVLEVWDSNVYEPSESIVLVSGTMKKTHIRTRDLRVSIDRSGQ